MVGSPYRRGSRFLNKAAELREMTEQKDKQIKELEVEKEKT